MEVELKSDNNAHQHTNNPPNDGGVHELSDDFVIELNGCLG
jgi:alpha-galactosidase/6-phospho-beta-glucosidase family protein